MDLQIPLSEPAELIQQKGCAGVLQKPAAQQRIGGMDRHKQGGQALGLNALPVGVGEVGEGEIGAVEKAEAVIVIFQIEAAAMTGATELEKR